MVTRVSPVRDTRLLSRPAGVRPYLYLRHVTSVRGPVDRPSHPQDRSAQGLPTVRPSRPTHTPHTYPPLTHTRTLSHTHTHTHLHTLTHAHSHTHACPKYPPLPPSTRSVPLYPPSVSPPRVSRGVLTLSTSLDDVGRRHRFRLVPHLFLAKVHRPRHSEILSCVLPLPRVSGRVGLGNRSSVGGVESVVRTGGTGSTDGVGPDLGPPPSHGLRYCKEPLSCFSPFRPPRREPGPTLCRSPPPSWEKRPRSCPYFGPTHAFSPIPCPFLHSPWCPGPSRSGDQGGPYGDESDLPVGRMGGGSGPWTVPTPNKTSGSGRFSGCRQGEWDAFCRVRPVPGSGERVPVNHHTHPTPPFPRPKTGESGDGYPSYSPSPPRSPVSVCAPTPLCPTGLF